MSAKRVIVLHMALGVALLVSVGCNPELDSRMATFNANATQVAASGGGLAATLAVTQPPTQTPAPNIYDLTVNTTDTLVHVWGQIYGLPSRDSFTIVATQQHVAAYIVSVLQVGGWQESVQGGTVTIGAGQIRLDLSLVDEAGATGPGTITFQPTLDSGGRLRLNLLGAEFGSLRLPTGLTAALGDAMFNALTGAASEALLEVNLTNITFENALLRITGTVR